MMIQVIYKTGKYDMVKSETLNRLLADGEIVQFRRSTGWTKVGRDPIRSFRQGKFWPEMERRQHTV